MIISRTPFRVSLFGGGTDYPKWFHEHGGAVFGFAINKYCYISIRPLPPFFEHRHRIVYSEVENVKEIEDIQHPAVRGVLMDQGVDIGIEIHHDGDLPARSGLGSSSSFTVGLSHSLAALKGDRMDPKTLAEEAIRIEQQVIEEHVGSQDQIWAAFGGINQIDFHKNGGFDVTPVVIPQARREELMGNLLLYFTGLSRFASEIAKKQIENIGNRGKHLSAMAAMVGEALGILQSDTRPVREIGELLHESWMLKRELADSVTTPEIDDFYQAALDAGAVGGKLRGAGGGGFVLLYVAPGKQAAGKAKCKDLFQVSFEIDAAGATIVVYEPDGLENR